MPIFYNSDERVLFVHVPKAAGTSVLTWFLANGWDVTNHVAHAGFSADILEQRFGLRSIPLEGPQPAGVSPQHADRTVFAQWGEFTYAFALVREPVARLRSHVAWVIDHALETAGDRSTRERAANAYLRRALASVAADPTVADNHLRRQVDFLDTGIEVLRHEQDWPAQLRARLALQPPVPCDNASETATDIRFEHDVAERALAYYRPDFEAFGYAIPSPAALTGQS